MDIGTLGVWDHASWPGFGDAQALAELERLGYGTAWLGGSPPADLSTTEPALAASTSLVVATGIVNVWEAPPDVAAAGYTRLAAAYPDRFVLGIGVSHAPIIGDRYTKPYDKLVSYLDGLDEAGVPASGRVLAALGPKVLGLARDRTGVRTRTSPRQNTPPRPAPSSATASCWCRNRKWSCPRTRPRHAHSHGRRSSST